MTDADQLARIAAYLNRAGVPLEGDAPGGLIPADATSVETVKVQPVRLTVAERVPLPSDVNPPWFTDLGALLKTL